MPSVAELFLSRRGDGHVGLRVEDDRWTWDAVVSESAARAAMLARMRRDGPFHVGVLLENIPEYLFLLGAAALSGATVVGINPTRRGAELARDIRHTDCQLVITDASYGGLLEGLDIGVEPHRVLRADDPGYGAALHQGALPSGGRRPTAPPPGRRRSSC